MASASAAPVWLNVSEWKLLCRSRYVHVAGSVSTTRWRWCWLSCIHWTQFKKNCNACCLRITHALASQQVIWGTGGLVTRGPSAVVKRLRDNHSLYQKNKTGSCEIDPAPCRTRAQILPLIHVADDMTSQPHYYKLFVLGFIWGPPVGRFKP